MPKNFDRAHLESVALRLDAAKSFLWRPLEGEVLAERNDFRAFDAVLTWCLESPTSRLISERIGARSDSVGLIELQKSLTLNPSFSTHLGERIAESLVKENWGEKSWLWKLRESDFYVDEITRALAMSKNLGSVILSIITNSELFERTVPPSRGSQALRISAQFRAAYEPGSTGSLFSFDQTIEESAEVTQVLDGLRAWSLAVIATSLVIYEALDDVEDPTEDVDRAIELVSIPSLDPQATTALAQTSERFIGLFSELLQSGKLGEFDQAAGEHSLRQFLGEMQNPEGATGHVVRGYEMKMVEIYHRHIGIQGLRLVADDDTVKQVESAITQAIEMGKAVEPEEAAKLAEPIPITLIPSPNNREKFTSALGWTSGAALSATVAGAGGAKLIDGLGELGKILPAPWGAMIGAVLGLLAYTFKPKGKS
jgi:hypothetical protein